MRRFGCALPVALALHGCAGDELRSRPDDGGAGVAGNGGSGGTATGGTGGTAGAGCGNVQSDADNCGECGRSCAGTPCLNGLCESETLYVGVSGGCMALGTDYAYFSGSSSGYPVVGRIPKAVGAAEQDESPIAASHCLERGSELVLEGAGKILTLGSAPPFAVQATVAEQQGNLSSLAAAADGLVAWTSWQDDIVASCDGSCGLTPLIVSDVAGGPMAVALDDSYYYFTEQKLGAVSRRLRTLAEPVDRLITGLSHPAALVLDGDRLYVGTDDALITLPKGGGQSKALVTVNLVGEIAVSDSHVYWTTLLGTLHRIAKSGGEPLVLAEGQLDAVDIAVDDTHVYWMERGGLGEIRRVAK